MLRLSTDVYRRHFSQRPSFELDGSQPLGNESLKYDYFGAGLTARQRITGNMWFGVDYR